jgi:hypothetical protein
MSGIIHFSRFLQNWLQSNTNGLMRVSAKFYTELKGAVFTHGEKLSFTLLKKCVYEQYSNTVKLLYNERHGTTYFVRLNRYS